MYMLYISYLMCSCVVKYFYSNLTCHKLVVTNYISSSPGLKHSISTKINITYLNSVTPTNEIFTDCSQNKPNLVCDCLTFAIFCEAKGAYTTPWPSAKIVLKKLLQNYSGQYECQTYMSQ